MSNQPESKTQNALEAALENVRFCADSTWHTSDYQRANKELLERVEKLNETDRNPTRARSVRDVIPNSRLATYANYEYDEARELSYASSASDTSFYYPCAYKREEIDEPWMLPEVEELFIWFTYSGDFNLSEPLNRENLERVDDKQSERHCSDANALHEIKPLVYENIERAPGKPRYTQCPNSTTRQENQSADNGLERTLKNMDLESMILENRLKSEGVKKLWNELSETDDDTKTGEAVPSTSGTTKDPQDDVPKLFKSDFQRDDQEDNFNGLKRLTNSFVTLEENLLRQVLLKHKSLENSNKIRSYSAVVQGDSSESSSQAKFNEEINALSLETLRSLVLVDEEDNAISEETGERYVSEKQTQVDMLPMMDEEPEASNEREVGSQEPLHITNPLENDAQATVEGTSSWSLQENTYVRSYSSQTPQSFFNHVETNQQLWLVQQQTQQQQVQSYYTAASYSGYVRHAMRSPQTYFEPCVASGTTAIYQWRQNPRRLSARQNVYPATNSVDIRNMPSTSSSSYSTGLYPAPSSPTTMLRYFYRTEASGDDNNDELERQAIEQYDISEEYVCDELEQQAIEQYENSEETFE